MKEIKYKSTETHYQCAYCYKYNIHPGKVQMCEKKHQVNKDKYFIEFNRLYNVRKTLASEASVTSQSVLQSFMDVSGPSSVSPRK